MMDSLGKLFHHFDYRVNNGDSLLRKTSAKVGHFGTVGRNFDKSSNFIRNSFRGFSFRQKGKDIIECNIFFFVLFLLTKITCPGVLPNITEVMFLEVITWGVKITEVQGALRFFLSSAGASKAVAAHPAGWCATDATFLRGATFEIKNIFLWNFSKFPRLAGTAWRHGWGSKWAIVF